MWSRLTVGGGFGRKTVGGHRGELLGRQADPDFRQQPEVARFERHRPRVTAQRTGLEFGEQRRDLLVRPVGQQPGEQQIPGLERVVVEPGIGRRHPAATGRP